MVINKKYMISFKQQPKTKSWTLSTEKGNRISAVDIIDTSLDYYAYNIQDPLKVYYANVSPVFISIGKDFALEMKYSEEFENYLKTKPVFTCKVVSDDNTEITYRLVPYSCERVLTVGTVFIEKN